jgi:hypothetical protein
MCLFHIWHILQPWRCRQYIPPKRLLTFNGLPGVISQNSESYVLLHSLPVHIRHFWAVLWFPCRGSERALTEGRHLSLAVYVIFAECFTNRLKCERGKLEQLVHPTGSLWRRQSQQSFNTLTPFNFHFLLTTCFGPYGPSSREIYN